MFRRIAVILLFVTVGLSSGVISCKKKDGPSTNAAKLVGKWKKTKYATDDNANGTIDSWEIHKVADGITNILEIKKDSTGVETTSMSPDLAFRWLLKGEITLETIYTTGDTFTYKVIEVSSSVLSLTTNTKLGLAGYYYSK